MDAKTAREKALSVQIKRFEGIVCNILGYIEREAEKERFELYTDADFDESEYIMSELSKLGYSVSSQPDVDNVDMYSLKIKW